MPRKKHPARLHLLSVREVQTAAEGDYSDGGGLLLRVSSGSASWVLRFTAPNGKRREMGLGACFRSSAQLAGKNLTDVRERAQAARSGLAEGIDPIDSREELRRQARAADQEKMSEARRERLTLARVARAYHESVIEPEPQLKSEKHKAQWINSLEQHVPPSIWHAPIENITAPQLLDFFVDVRRRIPETGGRIVQRLSRVFGDAEFRGIRNGNPAAAAASKLRDMRLKRVRGEFSALPYANVPAFMRELRKCEGIAARSLEFGVLTTARTSELLGALPAEFDLDAGIWTVPAVRMKSGDKNGDHIVYLSSRAIEIVREMMAIGGDFVFCKPGDTGRPLSNMAMLTLLRRMDRAKATTVHGLCRSTFSTWANETGAARPDVIEACLAHQERDRVRRAYNRAQFGAERRALLKAWADYCEGKAPARNNVVRLPRTT